MQKDNYSVRVIGTAKAMAPGGHVAVATATSTNFVDHSWNADVIPNQGASAASASVPVYASVPGGGSGGADVIGVDSSKSYIVPPTPQAFQYDADGNLIDDVLWHYTYDAENRLTSMYNNAAVIGASKVLPANARKLVFTYDYLGRRVEKQVYPWNGSAYATSAVTDRKFIYNGWNVVAEYDVLAGSALRRSYTWGLDLTGSFSATAGVGALVELTDHTVGKSYYPAYDQNGNVIALVNDAGSVAAAYEYSAFGELMRKDILLGKALLEKPEGVRPQRSTK